MAGNSSMPFDFSQLFGGGLGGLGSLFGGGGQQGGLNGIGSFGSQAGNFLAPQAQTPGLFSRQSLFGGTDPNTGISTGGWAPIALGAGQALFGAMQGQKATKLAESQFKEGVRQFDLNFNAQRKSINTDLEDRQRARVASNSGAYESVSDYLKKNAV